MLKVMMSKVMMWKMMMSYSGCFIWPGWVGMGSSTAITLIVSTDWLPCLPSFLLFSITFSSTLNFDCFLQLVPCLSCWWNLCLWIMLPMLFVLISFPLLSIITISIPIWNLASKWNWLLFFSGVNCYSSFELKRNWPTTAALISPDLLFTWMHLDLFFARSSHS